VKFLDSFQKELANIDGVTGTSVPPRYWFSTGNLVLNYIMSGNFKHGLPQGRITNFCGPSGAGKSYNIANACRAAQEAGAHVLVIDSENALDDEFMSNIGVDVDNNYTYVSVMTIAHVYEVVSSFINGYKKEYGDSPDAPKLFIVIDSLDMLMTDTELENYRKGVQKGDQGQKNKQLKSMLRGFVQDIKGMNVSMAVTSQVYKNQDLMNGEGVWIVADAVRYSASVIVLIQKRKLKEEGGKVNDVAGIRMICEGYKTRFTKPYQRVEIEVPYETGMDPYSGLVEVALKADIIEKKGSRYVIRGEDETWYSKDIAEHADRIVEALDKLEGLQLKTDDVEVETAAEPSATARRRAKAAELFDKTSTDSTEE
jgi:recombination protein RecA